MRGQGDSEARWSSTTIALETLVVKRIRAAQLASDPCRLVRQVKQFAG
jgi:hypothetical protein